MAYRDTMKTPKNARMAKRNATPIRLTCTLRDSYTTPENEAILRQYGDCPDGRTFIRELVVPSDIPLHSLHYALTKAFGFLNEHLHCYRLPDETLKSLCQDRAENLLSLSGQVFGVTNMDDDYPVWMDTQMDGSFLAWRRKQYTGPYDGHEPREDFRYCLRAIRSFLKRASETIEFGGKQVPIQDLPVEQFLRAFPDWFYDVLLERLELSSVLTKAGNTPTTRNELVRLQQYRDVLGNPPVIPFTTQLLYNYDYGDNWIIELERGDDTFQDLIDKGVCTLKAIKAAYESCWQTYRPVCVFAQGLNLVEDVGGVNGFCELLSTLHQEIPKNTPEENLRLIKEDQENMRLWAKGLDWKDMKPDISKLF
jgi:hypothetical protein